MVHASSPCHCVCTRSMCATTGYPGLAGTPCLLPHFHCCTCLTGLVHPTRVLTPVLVAMAACPNIELQILAGTGVPHLLPVAFMVMLSWLASAMQCWKVGGQNTSRCPHSTQQPVAAASMCQIGNNTLHWCHVSLHEQHRFCGHNPQHLCNAIPAGRW